MKKHIDYYLLATVTLLVILGLLFLSTLSAPASLKAFGTANYYILKQLKSFIIGLVVGIIMFLTPIHIIKKIAPWLLLGTLFMLIVVMIFGADFWGAQRWMVLGGIVIQPSEILKLASILYLSAWLSNRIKDNKAKNILASAKGIFHNFTLLYLPFLALLAIISIILIKQPDLSTLGIIGLTLLAIYFSAKTPVWHTVITVLGSLGALALLIKIEPYRLNRFLTFMNPEADPLGIGFQVKQSLIAVGSGGFFGKGLGLSSQKFGFLPQAMTDSIFPIIAEETGIVGSVFVICLFLFFIWQGFKIARNCTDKFAQLAAVGVIFWISFQAFVNISSSLGIWPLAGIPLPFFSYGGSHLLTELAGMGLLLNISKNA